FRVGHELLEVVDALPFVDDQDVSVADAEPVVQPADSLGCLGNLRELVGPVHQGLLELGRVALELTDDQHTHVKPLPSARAGGTGSPAGIRHRAGGRITRFPGRARGGWPPGAARAATARSWRPPGEVTAVRGQVET